MSNLSSFIWSVADLLRGDYTQSEYGKVILPFTVLRRLDCVLEATKADVLAELAKREKAGLNPEPFLLRKAAQHFYNTSPLDMKKLMGDQDHIGENLRAYIQAFSPAVRDIFESFEFHVQIDRLQKAKLLYLVAEKFANIDLHPDTVSNAQMGAVFEELIRKFAEASNATAGEHFTPRDAIRLMVNLLFIEDDDALTKPGVVRSLYDPTAGTGGMLSVAGEHLAGLNPDARLVMYGQELNPESYAICKADMLIKGQDIANIIFGNTLSADGLLGKHFDYMLSNPPFGVEWKKIEAVIRKEFEQMGFNGRFGPGLPRVSDGSLLFLLHLISKMRPAVEGGSRLGIVLNGSPLFTGGAGSGESEIRRYVLENDLVEAIITEAWQIHLARFPGEAKRPVIAHRLIFSMSTEQHDALVAAGLNPDQVLHSSLKKVMRRFSETFHPGDSIGYAYGLHHDSSHLHAHVALCPRTAGGAYVGCSTSRHPHSKHKRQMDALRAWFGKENERWSHILSSPQQIAETISKRFDSDKMTLVPRLTAVNLEALRNAQTAEAIRLQQSYQSIRNLEAAIVAKRQFLNAERNSIFVSRLLGMRKPKFTRTVEKLATAVDRRSLREMQNLLFKIKREYRSAHKRYSQTHGFTSYANRSTQSHAHRDQGHKL